jgi:hypothetical protein
LALPPFMKSAFLVQLCAVAFVADSSVNNNNKS